eukprot:6486508-Pyramimonas_sp.AAC.1
MEKCAPIVFRMLGLPAHVSTDLAQDPDNRMRTAKDICSSPWRRGGSGRRELARIIRQLGQLHPEDGE